MSESGMTNESVRRWAVMALIAFAGALLCGGFTLTGFMLGRLSAERVDAAAAQPQVVTEAITAVFEVTREVTVIAPATAEVTAAAEGAIEETAVSEGPAEPTPVPTVTPVARPRGEVDADALDFTTFREAWDFVDDRFDGALPAEEELLYAAIEGSLELLDDPFTRFIRPELAERMRQDETGVVEGIGAIVRQNDEGFVEIIRPIDDQPADLAGLRAGDLLIAVDGRNVVGENFDQIILSVRGPEGTTVALTILRDGQALEFTLTRARYEIELIEARMLPDNIAYLRLADFLRRSTEEELAAALADLLALDPDGLIFDLRDNPGGFLEQSVNVADLFLASGTVLYERNSQGLDEVYRSQDGDIGEEIPLVVLVNAGSASASEIVAGAIQDNGRAIVVGETTFGKGSVQVVRTLSDGSQIRVTMARWYTPANKTIDGQGITPDVEVATPEDLGGDDDLQLQRAVEILLNGNE